MVKATAAIGVIFFLVATGEALGQKQTVADDSKGYASVSSPAERQGERTSGWRSLPDAPSPGRPATEAEGFEGSGTEGRPAKAKLPLTLDAKDVMSETELLRGTPESQFNFNAPDDATLLGKPTGKFWNKYLYTPSPSQQPVSFASTSESFLGKTVSAASRILVARDVSGKERLNTAYLIAVLASAAAHASSRPDGPRSTTATLNNFGSTIGGDAGVNVFHAFQPDIGQVVKKVTPKFVYRIERHLTGSLASRAAGSISVR